MSEEIPEPNSDMLRAVAAIRLKYPNDVVNTFRQCDINALGEYSAHAWNRALDHWGKGLFAKSHMDTVFNFTMNNAAVYHVDRAYYRGMAYQFDETGVLVETQVLPASAPQHFDHLHIQFYPVFEGTPPGCA